MNYGILTDIDIILDEIKEWETELEAKWTDEQRMKYLNLKLETFQSFLMTQADYWDKELKEGNASTGGGDNGAAEAERRAAQEAQDREAAERIAAEKLAVQQQKLAQEREAQAARERDAQAAREREAQAAREREAKEKAEREAKDKQAAQERSAALSRQEQEKALAEKLIAQKKAEAQAASKSSSLDDLSDHLEAERKDVIFRIGRPANKQAADLTDPGVLEAYLRVRNDADPLMWFILGYGKEPNKLLVQASGSGDFDEMHDNIKEFVYLNHKFGDTQRSKFIFMTYVPDSLGGIKKSRVVGHRPPVEKMLKYIHLQWHILDKAEMRREILDQKLLAAGGANYSVQESDKGDFSGYKQTTKEFYQGKDKSTQLSGLVYEKGPLSRETPMDIGGRAMVATQSEFRSNIKTELK